MPYATPRIRVARRAWVLPFVLAQAVGFAQSRPVGTSLGISPVFASGSVWQRGAPVALHGRAQPRQRVDLVSPEFGEASAKTDGGGRWAIALPAHDAGGPYRARLTTATDTLDLDSIYVGDVFLCSGQSNMEWEVIDSDGGEAAAAEDRDPFLRHLKVPKLAAREPIDTLPDGLRWRATAPGSTERFTAVGYYFARALRQRDPAVPIGLLNVTWGGSTIEAWLPASEENPPLVPGVGDERRPAWASLQTRFASAFEPAGEHVSAGNLTPPLDSLPVGVSWQYTGLPDVDGLLWYETDVDLSGAEAAARATLSLGPVDDSDSTFVNGTFVGGMRAASSTPRFYDIAPELLRTGRNTISVKVEDTGGDGGLTGAPDSIYLSTAARTVALGDRLWGAKPQQIRIDSLGVSAQRPTMLYNAMLAPLRGVRVKAALWYQGESNSTNPVRAGNYGRQLATLGEVLRGDLDDPSLPLLVVELPEFGSPPTEPYATEDMWPLIRSAQQAALASDSNYATVVTLGLGAARDVHPRDKLTVGRRLADEAFRVVYGSDDGPVYARPVSVRPGKDGVTVQFSGVGTGLRASGGDSISGFAIEDEIGHWTTAEVEVLAPDQLQITSPVGVPIARVAYAWANNPAGANLVNGYGLPVSTFRLAVPK